MQKGSLLCVGILLLMGILGTTDALLVEKDLLKDWRQEAVQPPEDPPPLAVSQTSSLPAGGVQKITEPDVLQVTTVLGFELKGSSEATLIGQIVPPDVASVQSTILLKDGDRAGIVAWVDSPQVKVYFLALKEALHSTFSPEMRDLVDETQQREGKPTRNLLTFKDPLISEERIVFVRIRERLYELHVAEGMDQVMFELVETLTN